MNFTIKLSLILLSFTLIACGHSTSFEKSSNLFEESPTSVEELKVRMGYLRTNIHAQDHAADCKASYANWTKPGKGHVIIPVNTAIEIGSFRKGVSFTTLPTRKKILFEFNSTNMKMGIDEYLEKITSPEKISIEGMSEVDQIGIRSGKAAVGMSKQGVMTALGYPASHRTPSLEEKVWVYWTNRFKTFQIFFDEQGVVREIKY